MADISTPTVEALLGHSDWVRRLARNLVGGDPHRAEDLAQDAMALALERPPATAQNLRGWFARVVRNLHFQGRRREVARDALPSDLARPTDLPATVTLVEKAEMHRHLVECVLALKEPYRTTVLWRYFEGLTPTEIARQQDLSLATVTSRLTRAHHLLHERLDRQFGGDRREWVAALIPLFTPAHGTAVVTTGALLMSTKALVAGTGIASLALGWLVLALLPRGPDREGTAPRDPGETAAVAGVDAKAPGDTPLPLEQPPVQRVALTEAAPVMEPPESEPTSAPTPWAGELRGQVLSPQGLPVEGATVVLGDVLALEDADHPLRTTTDPEGRFRFEELEAGPVRVVAGIVDLAPSEALVLQVVEEETLPEVELVLRVGARLHGKVVLPDGSAAGTRKMGLVQSATHLKRNVVTDEVGAFDERHLHPGSWQVVVLPDATRPPATSDSPMQGLTVKNVDLEDGQDLEVVLGEAAARGILVRGTVTRGGRPLSGLIHWLAEGDDPMANQAMPRFEADGVYEVELTRPGPWLAMVMTDAGRSEFHLDIPDRAEVILDLEQPVGRIAGRVLDDQGVPVAEARVCLFLEEGRMYRQPLSIASDRRFTETDGTFAFGDLEPGLYSVSTDSNTGAHALATRTGLDLRVDASVSGIELVMVPGQTIRGQVLHSTGIPADGAPVWIYHPEGRPLNPITSVQTDPEGWFTTVALPEGEYTLYACMDGEACFLGQCLVDESGPEEVLLEMQPGGWLEAEVVGPDGKILRAQVRVSDAQGRLLSGLRNGRDLWSWRPLGHDSRARRVGPLLAGTHQVTAYVPALGARTQPVEIGPGKVSKVRFTFE